MRIIKRSKQNKILPGRSCENQKMKDRVFQMDHRSSKSLKGSAPSSILRKYFPKPKEEP